MTRGVLVLWLGVVISLQGGLPEGWHWRNPLPAGDPVTRVEYGHGRFVAAGLYGTIYESTDGTNWTTPSRVLGSVSTICNGPEGTTMGLRIVGELYSTDRKTWNYSGNVLKSTIRQMVYASNRFIGWTSAGYRGESEDGSNWVIRVRTGFEASSAQNGLLVTNGITLISGGSETPQARCYTGTTIQNVGRLSSFVFANDLYVAGGFDGFYWSTNGLSWSTSKLDRAGTVATFAKGTFWGFNSLGIWNSADGKTWQSRPGPTTNGLSRLVYGGGVFVAVANSALYYSEDAEHWQSAATDGMPAPLPATGNLLKLDCDAETVYACDGEYFFGSKDLRIWNLMARAPANFQFSEYSTKVLNFARCDDGFVVIAANGTLQKKPDATEEWRQLSPPPGLMLNTIACGKGLIALTAYDDVGVVLVTSADGTNWTERARSEPVAQRDNAVIFQNDEFIAWSADWTNSIVSVLWRSRDGTNWSAAPFNPPPGERYARPLLNWNGLLVLRVDDVSRFADVFTAWRPMWVDQLNGSWQKHDPYGSVTAAIVWKDTLLYGTGKRGLIQSDPIRELQWRSGTRPHLHVTGLDGKKTLRIERTKRLDAMEWQVVTNITVGDLPSLPIEFEQSEFFRASWDEE